MAKDFVLDIGDSNEDCMFMSQVESLQPMPRYGRNRHLFKSDKESSVETGESIGKLAETLKIKKTVHIILPDSHTL